MDVLPRFGPQSCDVPSMPAKRLKRCRAGRGRWGTRRIARGEAGDQGRRAGEVRVRSSRGRYNPRAVKRKVSKFTTRSRAKRTRPRRAQIQAKIVM